MRILKFGLLLTLALMCCMSTCRDTGANNCDKLLGNWQDAHKPLTKICFEKGGKYASIQDYFLSFKSKDTLDNGFEILVRQSGNTGIVGAWKTSFGSGEWLIYNYNADNTYSYEWNNGDKGTGHYSSSGNSLRVFEYRASYACAKDSVAITSLFTNSTTKYGFSISDTVLTLVDKDTTLVMVRF